MESLGIKEHHDVYPGIDPTLFYEAQAYKGKVVLISGASRGIGKEVAFTYARAGARVSLLARSLESLESVKIAIQAENGRDRVEIFKVDVTNPVEVKAAVDATVEKFGRIDIVIANAGHAGGRWEKPFTEVDPTEWWTTFEVNIRGVFNLAHYSIPHVKVTKGYFIAITSLAAQMLTPFSSAYGTSKHGLNRFVEFIASEHPEVKAFALHPGAIVTELSQEAVGDAFKEVFIDTLALPAATLLRLTSGKLDWLSSRFVSSNWDLEELETLLSKRIIEENALVGRLTVPSLP